MERLVMESSSRESSLRRRLTREGYALRKDRARRLNLDHLGGYMIVNVRGNWIAAGSRYDLDLNDVEEWLDGSAEE